MPDSRGLSQMANSWFFASLRSGRSRAFGGAEEYQHREALNDVIEAVFHPCGNKDDRAGVHIDGFDHSIRLSPHFRPAARHVIHLILVVGGLIIRRAGLKDIKSNAE